MSDGTKPVGGGAFPPCNLLKLLDLSKLLEEFLNVVTYMDLSKKLYRFVICLVSGGTVPVGGGAFPPPEPAVLCPVGQLFSSAALANKTTSALRTSCAGAVQIKIQIQIQ